MSEVEAFLEKARPKVELVEDVPEVGEVYLREYTGAERDAWDLFCVNNSQDGEGPRAGRFRVGTKHIRARLVRPALCDPEGKPLFAEDELDKLGGIKGNVLDWLYDEVRRRNGIGQDNEDELRKNSQSGQSDASG